MSWICVLSFQILCEEFVGWETQLVYKGEGVLDVKTRIYLGPGDLAVGGEFSHLHRFLDSTFAASFV